MAARAVLFDLDNTLWRTTETPDWNEVTRLQAEALAPELDRLGLKHPDLINFIERFWPAFGAADQAPNPTLAELKCGALIRAKLGEEGLVCSDEDGECLWEALHIPFRHFNIAPFPDAPSTVERLRESGYRLAVVTNRPVAAVVLARELLDQGFPDVFEAVVTSGEVGYRKPHPLVFQTALARLALASEDVIVVGDSYENDVVPAAKLGMTAVLKLNDHEPDEGWSLAAHQVASLEALLQLSIFDLGRRSPL